MVGRRWHWQWGRVGCLVVVLVVVLVAVLVLVAAKAC